MRPCRSIRLMFLAATAASAFCGPATAGSLSVSTPFSASAPAGNQYSYSAGPFPFNAFGIVAKATYQANPASVAFNGGVSFDMPTLTTGQQIATDSILPISYASAYSGTSLGGSVTLGGRLDYSYNIGPFSGSGLIGQASVNPGVSGGLVGDSPLNATTLTGNAALGLPGLNLGLSIFPVGSASMSINPSLVATEQVSWNSNFEYGYYRWTNTTGTLTATDTLTWVGVNPGDPLGIKFNATSTGAYFINVMPAIRMDGVLSQKQELDLKLTAAFYASVFGVTVVDKQYPLATLPLVKDGEGFTSNGNEWVADNFWSANVLFDDQKFTVLDIPTFVNQSLYLNKPGNQTPTGDVPGGFLPVPGLTDLPPPPQICLNNRCYNLDDPALPITGIRDNAVPEPTTWAMMLAGFACIGGLMRRKTRAAMGLYRH